MIPVVGKNANVGSDAYWMDEALAQARMASTIEEVPVGAIVVSAGEIISRACNRNRIDNDPCAHAEILALRQAAQQIGNYRLTDTTLFVTLEPCFMCAGAIIHARVKRVVFAPSSSVYGSSASSSSRQVDPISPYGVSKAACEQLAQVYRSRGLDVMAMRYFTVYGPRQRPDMAMNRLFRAALPGDYVFPLRGTGAQRREFTFVEDIVDATIRAGSTEAKNIHEPFDIGGGVSASLGEVIEKVEKIVGSSVRIELQSAAKGDPLITVADTEPAQEILNWQASTELQNGLEKHYVSVLEALQLTE